MLRFRYYKLYKIWVRFRFQFTKKRVQKRFSIPISVRISNAYPGWVSSLSFFAFMIIIRVSVLYAKFGVMFLYKSCFSIHDIHLPSLISRKPLQSINIWSSSPIVTFFYLLRTKEFLYFSKSARISWPFAQLLRRGFAIP